MFAFKAVEGHGVNALLLEEVEGSDREVDDALLRALEDILVSGVLEEEVVDGKVVRGSHEL